MAELPPPSLTIRFSHAGADINGYVIDDMVEFELRNSEVYPLSDYSCKRALEMPLVNWYRSYSVNNEELDGHHRKLFAILNRMYDSCLQAEDMDCVVPIIEELIEYTDYHFSAEEKYMLDRGFKGIEEHRQHHRYFRDKLLELRDCENKNDYDYKREVLVLLGNWILRHVTIEDKKYSVDR